MSAPVATGRVVEAAAAFAATLSQVQAADLHLEHTLANATAWSNLPEGYLGEGRPGLRTGTLSGGQWEALEALLAAATGSGFEALRAQLDADDWLRGNGGGDFYGRGNFTVAFLGAPSDSGTWELMFGGHHLALANTYVDGALVGATPSFRGIEPFGPFQQEGREADPGRRKHQALVELLSSLDRDQIAAARLPGAYRDVLLGPGRDRAFPERREGIAAVELGSKGATLLLAAIEAFVTDIEDEAAARTLARYAGELDSTHLAFAGSPRLEAPGDYVRIDGPSVWIEYSMHAGGVLATPHPHSVWRDRRTDYGGSA